MLKRTECQCCAIQAMDIVGKVGEYEQTLCKNCGYVRFVHSFDQVNHQLYESDADYNDDLSVAKDFEDFIQWNHNKALQYLTEKYPSRNAKILDVGCFSGFFVKKLILQGFVARGIDFNNKALSFGKEHYGLEKNISNSTLQELLAQGEKYDVITLFEVIEHLESISDVLSEVSKLLKSEGVIIISTPNSNMCWRPALDFPPHHLSRFTPSALQSCVIRYGFKPVKQLEQMSSYDLIRNYVGTFFRKKNKTSLRGGSFKNQSSIRLLRIAMNKLKHVGGILFSPVDGVLYALGFRYICQLIIAEKK
jgi:2-polyprenyl-3-methyl-5-hydroxy-6-metoxy-1,4-benzoquinol methylase